MVSVCLPSDALLQHLWSWLGFSYLGRGVSLHGCSSKAQPLLLTFSKSMKLWAMLCGSTQDGQVMVESSDKMWPTGEWNGKPLQYSCLENPIDNVNRQKDRTLKDELPGSVGTRYATGEISRDWWRNNSRKNEEMESKQKQYPVVDGTCDRRKVRCCKEQYCIGTWMLVPRIKANWKWWNRRSQEWTSTF